MAGMMILAAMMACWCMWLERRLMRLEAKGKLLNDIWERLMRMAQGKTQAETGEEIEKGGAEDDEE